MNWRRPWQRMPCRACDSTRAGDSGGARACRCDGEPGERAGIPNVRPRPERDAGTRMTDISRASRSPSRQEPHPSATATRPAMGSARLGDPPPSRRDRRGRSERAPPALRSAPDRRLPPPRPRWRYRCRRKSRGPCG